MQGHDFDPDRFIDVYSAWAYPAHSADQLMFYDLILRFWFGQCRFFFVLTHGNFSWIEEAVP